MRTIALCLLITFIITAVATANLLSNPGFETDPTLPDDWNTYGSGNYIWRSDDSNSGARSMELGSISNFSMLWQRIPGSTGNDYTCSVYAKRASGAGSANLKLEFHNASQIEIIQYHMPFTATSQWTQYSQTQSAPVGTAYVTASVVGEAGGTVLFDDVSITVEMGIPEDPAPPLPGDLNFSGTVDEIDLGMYVARWKDNTCDVPDWCSQADINRSGTVDIGDFLRVSGNWKDSLADIVGITHVAGNYFFGTEDFLNEGADRLLTLGTRVIKVWFTPDLASKYPWNSNWPIMNTLNDQAQAPYFVELFAKPFTTFILEAHTNVSAFRDGMSAQENVAEQQEFYDLTTHLLNTYQGTGKTFVLQHWEGDWLIRGHYDSNLDPTPTEIQGMIDWLNARQAGVDQARSEFAGTGVKVYHAAEVNVVVKSMNQGRTNVINAVVPFTNVDMVSYSAYDAIGQGPDLLMDTLDFIAANTPDSPDFGNKNVFLGEYGFPENERTALQYQSGITDATLAALSWGCQYIVYWELYCNENYAGTTPPITNNGDTRGFWLVKPDGTNSWSWDYFYGLFH